MHHTLHEQLKRFDFQNPDPTQQAEIIEWLRHLSLEEAEELYRELVHSGVLSGLLPNPNNTHRRRHRHGLYVRALKIALNDVIKHLPADAQIADLGCGDGEIVVQLFKGAVRNASKLHGCDIVDYCSPQIKQHLTFHHQNALDYLAATPDNTFALTMEVVTGHHLPSIDQYRQLLREMMRTTRPGGYIVVLETAHATWIEQLGNAVLDITLNGRTDRQVNLNDGLTIPVPLQFMSVAELEALLGSGARIEREQILARTSADPKHHVLYVAQVGL